MEHDEADECIENALQHVSRARLEPHRRKSKRLVFRLHDAEFDEIKETADALDMTVSEYLVTLHRYAAKRLGKTSDEAEWVHRTVRRGRRRDDDNDAYEIDDEL